jgi:hypothetical protein
MSETAPTAPRGYACAILLDGVHAPDSPAGGFVTIEAAARQARDEFPRWVFEILTRI